MPACERLPVLLLRAVPALALACAGAAVAQSPQPPAVRAATVSVDLTQVSADIARRLNVDEANMPMSVQLPHDEAAQVCAGPGGNSCTATRSSTVLDRLVSARMKADEAPAPSSPPMGAGPDPGR